MPRTFRLLSLAFVSLAIVVGIVMAAGCGGGGKGEGDPAKLAPARSVIYVSGLLRPDVKQKEGVDAIARKVFGVDDPGSRIGALIDRSIRRSSRRNGLTFKDDIEPWLGKRAAFALVNFRSRNPDGALIVASKDTDKAKDAVAAAQKGERVTKRSYKGIDYTIENDDRSAVGIVEDFLVVGTTEAGFRAVVDAAKGSSLDDAQKFAEAKRRGKDKLGLAYVDVKGVLDTLNASGGLGGQGQALGQLLGGANPRPAVATLSAQSNAATLELVATPGQRQLAMPAQSPLTSNLPGDSWAALGIPGLGQSLKTAISQFGTGLGGAVIGAARTQLRRNSGLDLDRDVIAAIGDLAVFVRGTSLLNLGGGLVIQSPDPAAARRLVAKLAPLIRSQGARSGVRVTNTSIAGARGLKVTSRRFPGSINAVVRGNKLVFAYGDPATKEALDPGAKLGSSADYQRASRALGGIPPSFFVAFAQIVSLGDGLSGGDPDWRRARRYLAALDSFSFGSRAEGSEQVLRMVLTLK